MRFSGAHFKYFFHRRGADRERCWFHYRSLSSVSLCPCEIQYPYFTLHNVSLWGRLACPKLKAFVLELGSKFQASSQFHDIEVCYFVSSTKSRQSFSFLRPLLAFYPAVTRRNVWHLRTDHATMQNYTETNPSQFDVSEYPVYLLVMGQEKKKSCIHKRVDFADNRLPC